MVKGAYAYSCDGSMKRGTAVPRPYLVRWSAKMRQRGISSAGGRLVRNANAKCDGKMQGGRSKPRPYRFKVIGSAAGDGGGGENFAEDGEDFGDAERLLEAARFVGTCRGWLNEIAGHVDNDGLRGAGGGENLLGGFVAGERVAVGNEVHVAQEDVVAAVAHELDSADGR